MTKGKTDGLTIEEVISCLTEICNNLIDGDIKDTLKSTIVVLKKYEPFLCKNSGFRFDKELSKKIKEYDSSLQTADISWKWAKELSKDIDKALEPYTPSLNNIKRDETAAKPKYNLADFKIKNGVLKNYKGKGGDVIIPDGVTSIDEKAFYKCSSLTSVTIPSSVTSIGYGAFSGCSSLQSITLPFVGGSKTAMSASSSTLFGYIFGTNSYAGGTATTQYYYTSPISTTNLTYYIPSSLKSITITGGNILCGAFYNCSGLAHITIGNSVTSIGEGAFESCSGLTSVMIGNGVTEIGDYAFYKCSGLTSITIPAGVTSIGKSVFWNCSGLTSVTISDSVTSIGESAFCCCSGLNGVTIGNSVKSIGDGAFWNCHGLTSITIPNSVTSIGDDAFWNCHGLTSVTIPNSVKSIGSSVFNGCIGLMSITLPFVGAKAGVTSSDTQYPFGYIFGKSSYAGGTATTQNYYGSSTGSATSSTYYIPSKLKSVTITGGNILYGAFYNCVGLTSVTIGNSITSIGEDAFRECIGLTSVTIGDNVKSIGEDAFWNCSRLTSIVVESGNTKYHSKDNCLIETATNTLILGCKNSVIPDYVTSIGDDAFGGCRGLTSVTIGTCVKSIGAGAFNECIGLASVTIGNGVKSIGAGAFFGCGRLASVTIGNSVTSIGNNAFWCCRGFTSIAIPNSVTLIGSHAFEGCSGLTSATIGNNVTSIGDRAFDGCSSLTNITFNGTKSQWQRIRKGNHWHDGVPATVVHCKD